MTYEGEGGLVIVLSSFFLFFPRFGGPDKLEASISLQDHEFMMKRSRISKTWVQTFPYVRPESCAKTRGMTLKRQLVFFSTSHSYTAQISNVSSYPFRERGSVSHFKLKLLSSLLSSLSGVATQLSLRPGFLNVFAKGPQALN